MTDMRCGVINVLKTQIPPNATMLPPFSNDLTKQEHQTCHVAISLGGPIRSEQNAQEIHGF